MPRHRPASPSRRAVLKAAALFGLAGGAPLFMAGCGGGADDATPTAGRETRHLHFDLSAAPVHAPRLHLLRSRHHQTALHAHDDASRARHRGRDARLRDVPDERLTHYLEDVDLPASALQSALVFGRSPHNGETVMAGAFMHVPAAVRAAPQQRATAARPAAASAAVATPPLDPAISPFDAAVFLVFHHPEVMNLNPVLGANILDRIASLPCAPDDATCIPLIGPLAERIAVLIAQNNAYPGTTPGNWMTLVPMTTLDGSPVLDDQGAPVYRYEIEDSVAALTGQVVQRLLPNIFNDPLFEGSNWRAPAAAASATVAAVPASAGARKATAARGAGASGAGSQRATATATPTAVAAAFAVAATIPPGSAASGIRMVGLEVVDAASRQVRLTIRNDYLRFLSVYVQYLDANEQPLAVDSPGALDTTRSRYVTVIGSNDQIMGVPFQGNDVGSSDIDITVPASAAHARVIFGSLGLGGEAFTPEAIAGACLTLALNIGIPTALLAAGVYGDLKEGWEGLFTNGPLLEALLTTLLGTLKTSAPGLATSIYFSATSQSAQSFLATLAGTVLQALLSAAPTLLVWLSGAIGSATLFAAALGPVGLAIKVLSVVADLAAIAVTVGEVFASPAITSNRLSLTMDTTVRIRRDPRDFQFPASATRYTVDAYYDGGGTPKSASGTVPAGQVDPIDVLLPDVPSGGQVVFHVSLYSADGCLVGSVVSEPLANVPATAALVPLQITELVAPLQANTQYQHHLMLGMAGGARAWLPAPAPSATANSLCQGGDSAVCALNGLTVHTATGMAGYGFQAGGQAAATCDGAAAAALNVIRNTFLGAGPDSGAKAGSCGAVQPIGIAYDPRGAAAGGRHFFVQPAADGFHLRQVSLDPAAPFDMAQRLSWGRFSSALDSLAVLSSGFVVGVNRQTHKMEVLLLPAQAVDQAFEPTAVPFGAMKAGKGSRPGLLDTPVAVASVRGTVYVLEQGNRRVQTLDPGGNPVLAFSGRSRSLMPLVPETAVDYLDLAVEDDGHLFVLSSINGGLAAADYRVDVYTPDGAFLCRTTGVAASRMAVDLFRNLYTLNFETVSGAPQVEPSLSQWLPVSPGACPSTLPATGRSLGSVACGLSVQARAAAA